MLFGTLLTRAMLSSNMVANTIGKTLYKNADKILLATGTGLIVGGTVSACVKTTTIKQIKENHRLKIEKINNEIEDKKERGKAKWGVYRDTAIDYLKTFGPCVLLTGTGITCILGSHAILSRRYASLQVAYSLLDKSFSDYRERVKEKIGAKEERMLFDNVEEHKIVEMNEDGTTTERTERIKKGSGNPYCFIFDESNPNWKKDPILNKTFLESREWYANDLLRRRKMVTLAEILWDMDFFDDMRDIPSYCFEMVWQIGDTGDNEIVFGYQEDEGFMAGEDPNVVLNFNCDGLLRKVRKEDYPILKTAKPSAA